MRQDLWSTFRKGKYFFEHVETLKSTHCCNSHPSHFFKTAQCSVVQNICGTPLNTRTPAYNGQFWLFWQKAHTFSLTLISLYGRLEFLRLFWCGWNLVFVLFKSLIKRKEFLLTWNLNLRPFIDWKFATVVDSLTFINSFFRRTALRNMCDL